MTDEEKAKEYMCKTPSLRDFNGFIVAREKDIKQAYRDGMVEGRKEKWHDLREDPNDLPKEKGTYWVYSYSLGYKKLCYMTVPYGERWGTLDKVIAWTELPKFKE